MKTEQQLGCDPDIQLMLRVRGEDQEAFDELCKKYRRQLMGFFYSLCWNADAAQDYTQEVLLLIWLSRHRYEPTAPIKQYIYKIARNHWLSTFRKRKCRIQPMYLEEVWQKIGDVADIENLLIRRYEDRRIKISITKLPEHYRLVFVLNHFEGMKYSEIAEILEIPIGTVKSRMSSAVKILRESLKVRNES